MSEELIHVRLNYPEALQSKKDMLLSQASLIKTMRIIETYGHLRVEELKLKLKLKKKFKELVKNFKDLHKSLPKLELPEFLTYSEEIQKIDELGKRVQEKKYDENLDVQLKEIQDKLRNL